MPEETFKYTADFSQLSDEIDKVNAKVVKLSESLERVSKKFGENSPQATMVKHSLDRVSADLDKKIADLQKGMQQKYGGGAGAGGGGGGGGAGGAGNSSDKDLERRYKRESLKYYREYNQARRREESYGKEFQNLFKGLSGRGGIFNPQTISSFINLVTGGGGKGGGIGIGGVAANVGGGMLGARVAKGAAGAATAAEEAGAVSASAGTAEAMTIGVAGNLLKRPGIITAIASAAVAADFVIASRGAARGKFAAGIGGTVGGIAATQMGYDRYLDDPNGVMRSMMEARYDITSPQYRALALLGINPRGKKPEDLTGQAAGAVSKQLKGFGKVDESTLLTLAHVTGMGNLGFSDEDLIRLYHGDKKEIADVAKKARADKDKYDLSPDQVKALQDNVQWMKEWATEGETLVEKGVAIGTQFTELASKELPDLLKMLDDLVKQYDILSPALNAVNKEFEALGKGLHDWIAKHLSIEPDVPTAEGNPVAFMGAGGAGGGFRLPGGGGGGRRGGVYGRTTDFGDIKFPAGGTGGTGKKEPGLYATDVGLAASKDISAEEAAFLDTLGTGETPGGSYSNKSGDPGGLGGRYQFLLSTWRTWAVKAGVDPKDFSAANQDKVALFYANAVVKGKSGKTLKDLLAQGPEGVRAAISATSPGVWNGIANVDPDKAGHSGAVRLWMRKLEEERKARGSTPPGEKVSMNNMDSFQGNNKAMAIHINNPAGASYQVSGGMLGASAGNYGNA